MDSQLINSAASVVNSPTKNQSISMRSGGGGTTSGIPGSGSSQKLNLKDQQALAEAAQQQALEDRRTAIITSTFANLELQTTKNTLEEYMDLFEEAKVENQKLAEEMKERERDALEVVEFLRQDIETKKSHLRKAEQKLQAIEGELTAEHHVERKKLEVLLDEKDDTIHALNAQVSRLNEELEAVALFQREKQEISLSLLRYKESEKQLVNKYEKELTKLRFQSLEDKIHLRTAEKEMVEKFNEEVDARALLLVDSKARGIHQENMQLAKEKASLEREMNRYTKLTSHLKEELQLAKREAELGAQTLDEYAKEGVRMTRAAKQSTTKARHLEGKIATLSSDFEHNCQKMEVQSAQRIQDLEKQLEESRNIQHLQRQELMKMRQLASTIVKQRGDLETFFYEALDFVRTQKNLEAKQRQRVVSQDALRQQRPLPHQVEAQWNAKRQLSYAIRFPNAQQRMQQDMKKRKSKPSSSVERQEVVREGGTAISLLPSSTTFITELASGSTVYRHATAPTTASTVGPPPSALSTPQTARAPKRPGLTAIIGEQQQPAPHSARGTRGPAINSVQDGEIGFFKQHPGSAQSTVVTKAMQVSAAKERSILQSSQGLKNPHHIIFHQKAMPLSRPSRRIPAEAEDTPENRAEQEETLQMVEATTNIEHTAGEKAEERPQEEMGKDNDDEYAPDFTPTPTPYFHNVNAMQSVGEDPVEVSNVGGEDLFEFSGLSWEDKEKIIRALLFRINSKFYHAPNQATVGASLNRKLKGQVYDQELEEPAEEEEQRGILEGYEVLDEPMHQGGVEDEEEGEKGRRDAPSSAISNRLQQRPPLPSSATTTTTTSVQKGGNYIQQPLANSRPTTRGALVQAGTPNSTSMGETPVKGIDEKVGKPNKEKNDGSIKGGFRHLPPAAAKRQPSNSSDPTVE